MYIEAIVQTVEEAVQAEKLGVNRLELVSGMGEGGLTPSYATIKQVLRNVHIPVQIMVRPHSYHFDYSEKELETIYEDVQCILELGGRGIVFGALHPNKTLHMDAIKQIADMDTQLDLTVHRAFDEVPSLISAYKELSKVPSVKRILTSGGNVSCAERTGPLRELVDLSKELNGPNILPGGGLSISNIHLVKEKTGASEYHFGSGVRVEGNFAKGFDEEVIAILKKL